MEEEPISAGAPEQGCDRESTFPVEPQPEIKLLPGFHFSPVLYLRTLLSSLVRHSTTLFRRFELYSNLSNSWELSSIHSYSSPPLSTPFLLQHSSSNSSSDRPPTNPLWQKSLSDFDKLFPISLFPEHRRRTFLLRDRPCFQIDPSFQISELSFQKFRRPGLACRCPGGRRTPRRPRPSPWRTGRKPHTCWRGRSRCGSSRRLSGQSSSRRRRRCSGTGPESIRFSSSPNSDSRPSTSCRSGSFEEDISLLWRLWTYRWWREVRWFRLRSISSEASTANGFLPEASMTIWRRGGERSYEKNFYLLLKFFYTSSGSWFLFKCKVLLKTTIKSILFQISFQVFEFCQLS